MSTLMVLPSGNDDAAIAAARLTHAIEDDPSILFVVVGTSSEAQTLMTLAVNQALPGAWVRQVVWIKEPVILSQGALPQLLTDPRLGPDTIGFTISFGNRVADVITSGDTLNAPRVFDAYNRAEAA